MPIVGSSTITYDQRYRPVTLYETADTDALSVRAYKDLARNANVLKIHNTPWRIGTTWRGGLSLTPEGTAENYLCQFGPLPCPSPFTRIRWRVGGYRTGATDFTIRVYSHALPYADAWTGLEEVSSIALSSSSHTIAGSVVDINCATGLVPIDTVMPYTFLVITGQAAGTPNGVVLHMFGARLEPDEPT